MTVTGPVRQYSNERESVEVEFMTNVVGRKKGREVRIDIDFVYF
jgi:hypothetical protein